MKGIIRSKAGKEFSTMEVREIKDVPLKTGEIRVRMVSSRINPVDMDLMKGFPGLKYKDPQIGGVDGAGEVIEVGTSSRFVVGDKVFFYRLFTDIGTWAEEITIPENAVAKIPDTVSLEDAGAIALPLLTAYEGLISLQPKVGDSILIHGAGGGVGFQAVQLAKQLGLKVIANASDRDHEDLEKAGIDQFINYKSADFSEVLKSNPPTFIFDVLGKGNLMKSTALGPKAVVSTALPDVASMHKTGVQLSGLLKFVMRMMGRKFHKLAKKNNVQLIGQVTGANGEYLSKAVAVLNQKEAIVTRQQRIVPFSEIAASGLDKSSLGKVIHFQK